MAHGIPLRDRDGLIRAYAIVDETDFDWLSQWAWYQISGGYAVRTVRVDGRRRMIYLHRFLLGLEHGDKRQGDHINRNKLDCRRANLRIAPHAQFDNQQNRAASGNRNNTSGYRGVTWHKAGQKWMARVADVYLGLHDTPEAADRVAKAFRAKHMPFSLDAA